MLVAVTDDVNHRVVSPGCVSRNLVGLENLDGGSVGCVSNGIGILADISGKHLCATGERIYDSTTDRRIVESVADCSGCHHEDVLGTTDFTFGLHHDAAMEDCATRHSFLIKILVVHCLKI